MTRKGVAAALCRAKNRHKCDLRFWRPSVIMT
jgi:hypothetical protein